MKIRGNYAYKSVYIKYAIYEIETRERKKYLT